MTSYERVTAAWHSIHADHPEIYTIAKPKLITRMKHRDFAKIVERICNLEPGSSVLEAGCGSGRDSLFFSYKGYRCHALDINDSPLEKLRRARAALALTQFREPVQLTVEQGDIFRLPYADNGFDFVFNSGVVEHYDEPTRRLLLAEMSRVTRPGGFVSVVFPNKYHLLDKYWSALIKTWTDFDSYEIPEQPLDSTFACSIPDTGLGLALADWIDCYDTLSHYPAWLPLRVFAYAATVCLPRPPQAVRRKLGTRSIVIWRKTGVGGQSGWTGTAP